MRRAKPAPISNSELRSRWRRVTRVARVFGFVGRVEYRHTPTNSGGAQYGLAKIPENDLLVVYPKAFERDADPEDFTLEAIIAHERGHQLLSRIPRLVNCLHGKITNDGEEVIGSLLGSLIIANENDQELLVAKATFDALRLNENKNPAELRRAIAELREILREFL
jgi:hypothetical protein